MAKKPKLFKRTTQFRWEARGALYEHFKNNYGLDKADVDEEIRAVMAEFRLRRNQAIETKELWQKVGLQLEKKLGKRD